MTTPASSGIEQLGKRSRQARNTEPEKPDPEALLVDAMTGFVDDPLGFVRFNYPWGVQGTQLALQDGPDDWQIEALEEIARRCKAGLQDPEATAIKMAVASGHGIGKGAFAAWVIHWACSTRPHIQAVVTANTKTQLLTKTWRELAKWHNMSANKHWFRHEATSFKKIGAESTWFASAIPWSEHNSEAFAGTHDRFVLMLFDEGSKISDKIYEVTEGAMTTPMAMWLVLGNPTRNSGMFHSIFHKFKHRWWTRQIDSRRCKMANKKQIQQWIDDYGEDHDFVRVRVRGLFPRAGDVQLISGEAVNNAMDRLYNRDQMAAHAKVMGIDVARHGDDQSAIIARQGLWSGKCKRFRIADLMQLAAVFVIEIEAFGPDAVFVDVTGMGWGVYDRLQQLIGTRFTIIPVQVGESAQEPRRFRNVRMEIWYRMKYWVDHGAMLEPDNEMDTELTTPEYGFNDAMIMELESKDDMKARGLASPDGADALAVTFYTQIEPKNPPRGAWWTNLTKVQGMKRRTAETS